MPGRINIGIVQQHQKDGQPANRVELRNLLHVENRSKSADGLLWLRDDDGLSHPKPSFIANFAVLKLYCLNASDRNLNSRKAVRFGHILPSNSGRTGDRKSVV